MNIAAGDRPLLVAPRPVRVSGGLLTLTPRTPPEQISGRVKAVDGDEVEDRKFGLYADAPSVSDRDVGSPRASSR
jgi:hypothetical protein